MEHQRVAPARSRRRRGAVRLWVLWVIANALGSVVAAQGQNAVLLVGMLVIAVPLSIAQWLVLRMYISRVRWWIPATIAGVMLGSIVSFIIRYIFFSNLFDIVFEMDQNSIVGKMIMSWHLVRLTFIGLFCGMIQMLVFRPKYSILILWICVSIFGFMLYGSPFWTLSSTYSIIISGIIYGTMTGGVLVMLIE